MNVYEKKLIHNENEEMVILAVIGFINKKYISEEAKKIYNSLTNEEKNEIRNRLRL